MSVELHTSLPFATGTVTVVLTSDFYCNSFTKDPYPHSHPKYELHYIRQGSCILRTGQEVIPCTRGQFLLLPPHCVHRLLPAGQEVQTISFLFSGNPELFPLEGPRLMQDDFEGEQRLLRIGQELTGHRHAYGEKIQGELLALLADLSRACDGCTQAAPTLQDENRAERIESYLAAHGFQPDCSCEALARELGLSTRQVHRLCLRYFNASFRELLTRMRMGIAAHRLRTTNDSVAKIAAELGYSSPVSFSSAYKNHFGIPPSKERS